MLAQVRVVWRGEGIGPGRLAKQATCGFNPAARKLSANDLAHARPLAHPLVSFAFAWPLGRTVLPS